MARIDLNGSAAPVTPRTVDTSGTQTQVTQTEKTDAGATPPWTARGPSAQRAVSAPVDNASTEAPRADMGSIANAYTGIRAQMDTLEHALKGMPESMRAALAKGLAGEAELPASLQTVKDLVVQTSETKDRLLGALTAAAKHSVTQLIKTAHAWPKSNDAVAAYRRGQGIADPEPETITPPASSRIPAGLTAQEYDVYGNMQMVLDNLEAKLGKLSPADRTRLATAIASGKHAPADLKAYANAGADAADVLDEQLQSLPAESAQKVSDLINKAGTWPMSDQLMTAAENSPATKATEAAIAKLTPAGKEALQKVKTAFGWLEPQLQQLSDDDYALVKKDLAEGKPVPTRLQQSVAEAVEAQDYLDAAMAAAPDDQQRASQDLMKPDHSWPKSDALLIALRAGLAKTPAAGAASPQLPQMPRTSQAVASAVQDGRLEMRELAKVLDAMAYDSQAALQQGPQVAAVAAQQRQALLQFLVQHAKVAPQDQATFARIGADLQLVMQQGGAPGMLETLAQNIAAGRY